MIEKDSIQAGFRVKVPMNKTVETDGSMRRPSAFRHHMLPVIVVSGMIAGACCLPMAGCASVPGMESSASGQSSVESPANYGTSPEAIANGGREARANGKEYRVVSETGIECCEEESKGAQVIYQNKDAGLEDAWGNKYHNGFPISCLHVTDDSLVFIEYQSDGSSESYYDIIRTNLDGTGREVIRQRLVPNGYGTRQWTNRSFMWLDRGYVYFVDNDCIWRQPLDGTEGEQVAAVGHYDMWAVDEGVIYCSVDGGQRVDAQDVESGTSRTLSDDEVPTFMKQ